MKMADGEVDDLESLDRLNSRLGQNGRVIEAIVSEKEDELVLVDSDGVQIPFEEVVKALFG